MTATINIKDLNNYTSALNLVSTKRTIRFCFRDIFNHQPQIVAIWRSLRAQNLHPVAHTFLGKIISITLQP